MLRDMDAAGAKLTSLEALLYGGQAHHFYRSIEAAKVSLSSGAPVATIDLRRLGLQGDVRIEQSEFQRILTPLLVPVELAIDRALAQAKVSASRIASVVRTGGSSQLPAFIDLLDQKFGPDRVQALDPFKTVVTGLAKPGSTVV